MSIRKTKRIKLDYCQIVMEGRENLVLERIINEAKKLPAVSLEAARKYNEKKEILIGQVNEKLKNHPLIKEIIGQGSLELMFENHVNHANFMANVFRFNQLELLAKTIPWVYRSYKARGFSYDYFSVALQAWSEAVEEHLANEHVLMINSIYTWMLAKHGQIIEIVQEEASCFESVDPPWQEIKDKFFFFLLQGEYKNCLILAMESVNTSKDLAEFYLQVIQPSMYQIGLYWEKGEISIAQEHLAAILVSRVMTALYPRFMGNEQTKGRAVVTSAPNEYHELGALMVADLLEIDGWDVKYLGANTPVQDLLRFLKSTKPHLLAISVTMAFNLENAARLIEAVKADPELGGIKIMVGGLALQAEPELWHKLGADAGAADARIGVLLAREWWNCIGI